MRWVRRVWGWAASISWAFGIASWLDTRYSDPGGPKQSPRFVSSQFLHDSLVAPSSMIYLPFFLISTSQGNNFCCLSLHGLGAKNISVIKMKQKKKHSGSLWSLVCHSGSLVALLCDWTHACLFPCSVSCYLPLGFMHVHLCVSNRCVCVCWFVCVFVCQGTGRCFKPQWCQTTAGFWWSSCGKNLFPFALGEPEEQWCEKGVGSLRILYQGTMFCSHFLTKGLTQLKRQEYTFGL